MPTYLHISDLHFGPHYLPSVGKALLHSAERLAPDAIIISGDLTQRAKRTEFADARAFIEALPNVPTAVIPGNHDAPLYRVWERLTDPFGNYQEFIHEELDQTHQWDGVTVVALNSVTPHRRIVNGSISREQLAYCREAFAAAPAGSFKIVTAHHHFAPAPDYDETKPMPGAKRALDHFQRQGVALILGGHLHRAYIGNSLDVYPGAHRDRGIVIVHCGTSTSRRGRAREREKNSFNVIDIEADTIAVAHWMYFSDQGGFIPTSRHLFPRGEHPYFSEDYRTLTSFSAPNHPSPRDSSPTTTRSAPGTTENS